MKVAVSIIVALCVIVANGAPYEKQVSYLRRALAAREMGAGNGPGGNGPAGAGGDMGAPKPPPFPAFLVVLCHKVQEELGKECSSIKDTLETLNETYSSQAETYMAAQDFTGLISQLPTWASEIVSTVSTALSENLSDEQKEKLKEAVIIGALRDLHPLEEYILKEYFMANGEGLMQCIMTSFASASPDGITDGATYEERAEAFQTAVASCAPAVPAEFEAVQMPIFKVISELNEGVFYVAVLQSYFADFMDTLSTSIADHVDAEFANVGDYEALDYESIFWAVADDMRQYFDGQSAVIDAMDGEFAKAVLEPEHIGDVIGWQIGDYVWEQVGAEQAKREMSMTQKMDKAFSAGAHGMKRSFSARNMKVHTASKKDQIRMLLRKFLESNRK